MTPTTWGELIREMVMWQRKQFPESTSSSTLKHLKKEIVNELESNPSNLDEWVDIFFFAIQGMDRAANEAGIPDHGSHMLRKVIRKLDENRFARTWPGPDSEGVYEHIKPVTAADAERLIPKNHAT